METAFFPLDSALGLLDGQYTPHVQEHIVRLSAWMPFAEAVKTIEALLGVGVSKASAVRMTEGAGAAYVKLQEEQVCELERRAPVAPPGAVRSVVSADGAFVPLRGGKWGEVRTLVIGEVPAATTTCAATPTTTRVKPSQPGPSQPGPSQPGPSQPGPAAKAEPAYVPIHTHKHSYFSRLAPAEEFTRQALAETHLRGLENSAQVAAVLDGAEWLQAVVDHHCPQAVRILDFPHAAQRIAAIGQALFGEGSAQATTWTQLWTHRLKHEGPQPLLAELRRLRTQSPNHDLLRINLAYLEKRQRQMRYPEFQQQGWPIGSGLVESANKLVVEARLKGAGMHWHPDHVNPMLALRNILCSDRWDQDWPKIEAALLAQSRHKSTQRCRQRLQTKQASVDAPNHAAQNTQTLPLQPEPDPQPSIPPPNPDKPARKVPSPDHPWRRFSIGCSRYPQNQKPK